jgi:hypothetical protein
MSEAVPIISVSASAIVGVGGLAAAAWGSSRERRWQSREERATELRAVLDEAAEAIVEPMFAFQQALEETRGTHRIAPIWDLGALQKRMVVQEARIGIRLGWQAPEYTTYLECWGALKELVDVLVDASSSDELSDEQRAQGQKAWQKALVEHRAFLAAAASTLAHGSPKRSRFRRQHRNAKMRSPSVESRSG